MSKSLPEIIDNHFLYRYCDSPVAYESPSRAGQKMGRSGIFLIPITTSNNPDGYIVKLITSRLLNAHHLEPLGRWSLEHRLYRENRPTGEEGTAPRPTDPSTAGYLQLLSRSNVSEYLHVSITDAKAVAAKEPSVIVALPAPIGGEDFTQLINTRMGPLWLPRQTLHVSNGLAYSTGEFVIRYGELRQGQGSAAHVRGVVVEVEWTHAADEDLSAAEATISAFWDELEMKDAKKFFGASRPDLEFPDARLWVEVLKLGA